LLWKAVAGVAVAAALASAAAYAASAPLTITSPRSGATIRLQQTPSLAVAGTVAFAPVNATSTKFYLRRDGCGTAADNPHMSTTAGDPDAGDGCGSLIYVVGVGSQDTSTYTTSYPASDGVPFLLDATRTVQGVVDVEGYQGVTGTGGKGVGQLTVNVSLDGLADGQVVNLGSDAETVTLTPPTTDYAVPFTITLPSSLDDANVDALALNVRYSGPYAGSGFTGLSGKSWVTVPTLSASRQRSVEVSLDDPNFGQPITASLIGSATGWSVAVPTPAVGRHTVYARSVQGGSAIATASSTFKVAK
jgi:hypothetical protein